MGGVLKFSLFEDAEGDEASALAAISAVVPDIDTKVLRSLGSRRIEDKVFFGDWYDAEGDALLRLGRHRTSDGRELTDPCFEDLDSTGIVSGSSSIPDAGSGGQFAYAFSCTPYGLRAKPSVVQERFRKIRDIVLPPDLAHAILDWSHPRLPEASPYFAAGMEWWGVFLFTVHVPALGRLTGIAGSATD